MTLEQYTSVVITELARLGLFNEERPCITVKEAGELVAVFRLAGDGNSVNLIDVCGAGQSFGIVWRCSRFGRFPLFLDGSGRPCRKIYRARNGWGGRQDFKERVLYKSQTLSRYQRQGRGSFGKILLIAELEDLVYEPNRKWMYKGRKTSHYKRIEKAWQRVFGSRSLPV